MDKSYFNTPTFLASFNSGNRLEFKKLFDVSILSVTRILIYRCKWATRDEIEDFVTFAYTRVYERLGSYESLSHIINALVFYAYRESMNYMWAGIRRKKRERMWIFTSDIYGSEEYREPEEDKMIKVFKEVDKLSARDKTVFELSFMKMMTPAEIAPIIGVKEQVVRNYRAKIIQQMRKDLGVQDWKRPTERLMINSTAQTLKRSKARKRSLQLARS